MLLKKRRLLLLIAFLWGVSLLFFPVRNDVVTAVYKGDTPDTHLVVPADYIVPSSMAIGFNGHPAGIGALFFFALMPFFIVWESFNFRRPFTFGVITFLRLQSLLLFLGAPYCYYIATYEQGNFFNTEHSTELAWGGWVIFLQNIVLGVFLFTALLAPGGKFARFFDERETEMA